MSLLTIFHIASSFSVKKIDADTNLSERLKDKMVAKGADGIQRSSNGKRFRYLEKWNRPKDGQWKGGKNKWVALETHDQIKLIQR